MKPSERPSDRSMPRARSLSRQALDQALLDICDVLRRGSCASALRYVPELTWIFFLRFLDEQEGDGPGASTGSIGPPYRFRDWARPEHGAGLLRFVNEALLPHLRGLGAKEGASVRQRLISEIFSGVDRAGLAGIESERDLLDVLDRVRRISVADIDDRHVFPLSQIYEGLLSRMGDQGSDAGQFFTPREVVRAMVRAVDPRPGETLYDPCCGTGGFLAQAYEHVRAALGERPDPAALAALKERTLFGREKERLIYPLALANLALHGVDLPRIWLGNALTGEAVRDGLWRGAPATFDVVLTNPPFGGKEGRDVGARFPFPTAATQVLFLQHILSVLAPGGRCGVVLDEGVLFRTGEDAFVRTKERLLSECELYCVVSLPIGAFAAAGAGVKTDLLFFRKGRPTETIWYYDLSDRKIGKRAPLTLDDFGEFLALLPERRDSARSWTVDLAARRREAAAATPREQRAIYDLKAQSPRPAGASRARRTPAELLAVIDQKEEEVAAALRALRRMDSA